MNAREAITLAIKQADMIVGMYLSDLSDADLLVRPIPGINHIAWQLGHLIASENGINNAAFPGSMPDLPPGFAEKHTKETAGSDDPSQFLTKAEYVAEMQKQRAATFALIQKVNEADLGSESPEAIKSYAPTLADALLLQGSHWLMHAGQWAVTRRKLGKPPMF